MDVSFPRKAKMSTGDHVQRCNCNCFNVVADLWMNLDMTSTKVNSLSLCLFSFWEVGEPNNHIDEDCGYIVKTRVLERVAIRSWYDAPCTMSWPYICEKEMGAGASTAIPH